MLTPVTNGGEKWRLAYYEGGAFLEYPAHLEAVIGGLVELGWIEPLMLPSFEPPDDTRQMWQYLAEHAESDTIQFVADAYWSANWDDALRAQNRAAAIRRLSEGRDIDLVIAMGTWAGLDLANDRHRIPTVVVSASDAVGAGIVESAEDSGYDHVHAHVDPTYYERQIRLFHDIVGFARLGVVYEDSPDGRTYANLTDLERVAAEREFALVECHAQDNYVSESESHQNVLRCFKVLAPDIDALWLSAHRGMSAKFMPEVLDPLYEHQVATWSQVGAEEVRRGVLISVARRNLEGLGLWMAKVIAKIFHGARPRDLSQVYEWPLALAINLETAQRIGFDPPESVLSVSDQVYEHIQSGSLE